MNAPIGISDGQLLQYQRREYLFREGTQMQGIYILHAGKVKIMRRGKYSKPHIVRLKKAGDWLGLDDLKNIRYNASAIALEPVFASFISKDEMLRLLERNFNFSIDILRSMCEDIKCAEKRMHRLASKKARERVAEMLLELENLFGQDPESYLNVRLTLQELADFAGVTSETMSRLMNDWRRMHLLDRNDKRIRLLEPIQLQQIAGLL